MSTREPELRCTTFDHVYLTSTGRFLPGQQVSNEEMDAFITPVEARCSRIKQRILRENGIRGRYYAIDKDGRSLYSNAQLAAHAARDALARASLSVADLDLLATGTTGVDLAAPGFANQVQGELGAPPLRTLSVQGICASGVGALQSVAHALELGDADTAMVTGSDFPSRLFKRDRFIHAGDAATFDAHFLRYMLSDGAGAALFSRQAQALPTQSEPLALKLRWVHTRSFSGDLPNCMSVGGPSLRSDKAYLDFHSLREAEEAGSFLLRQDIRLLPNLFDLGISELVRLVRAGYVQPSEVSHFLCHYSSAKFRGVVRELLEGAEAAIPEARWYSNLETRGNTGAASIFVMLDEFLETTQLSEGETVFCFVPESGRFTVSYMLFDVVRADAGATDAQGDDFSFLAIDPESESDAVVELLRELGDIWHRYRSRVFRSPLAQAILNGTIDQAMYVRWMESWIPQVRQGSVWMREAIGHLPASLAELGAVIEQHAGEEQFDYEVLYRDYRELGGSKDLDALSRNPGGEALNAFMMSMARSPDSFSLLGGTYLIEGTGQRIIPTLLPRLRSTLGSHVGAYRFLQYHGENDVAHMQRWLRCVRMVVDKQPGGAARMAQTAAAVAELYALQWELAATK